MVALLRENFYHVATGNFVAQRNHLSIHLCAHALVADFGLNHVSKIDRSGAARKFHNAAFRSESVNFNRGEIDFQGGEKFSWFLKLLRPFDELTHPGDALVVILRRRLCGFVFPVRGNAFLRDAMHVLRADLHFEGLTAVEHGGVQRLVKIWPGDGDVVFESSGDWTPDVMDDAESRVTAALGIGDDAHGQEIVDLAETDSLANDFAMHGVQTFYARFELGRNPGFDEPGLNGGLDFLEKFFVGRRLIADFFLQSEEGFRLEIAERQVLELATHHAHAEAERDGRI